MHHNQASIATKLMKSLHILNDSSIWVKSSICSAISWCYVFVNLCLGMYFFFADRATQLRVSQTKILVWDFITLRVWGIVFLMLGLWIMYALLAKKWNLLWIAMMTAFSVKLLWSVALIFASFRVGILRTLGSIGIWFALSGIQAIVMVYLFPREVIPKNVGEHTN